MQIKEIQTKEEILQTFVVLKQIYENLPEKTYILDVQNIMKNGYKMAGVFENEICLGVVGFRITEKLQFGKVLEIEDFMIDRNKRGIGIGKMLIRHIDWQAMKFQCKTTIGNLKTIRQESQKIFAREKFLLDGFLFKKTNN